MMMMLVCLISGFNPRTHLISSRTKLIQALLMGLLIKLCKCCFGALFADLQEWNPKNSLKHVIKVKSGLIISLFYNWICFNWNYFRIITDWVMRMIKAISDVLLSTIWNCIEPLQAILPTDNFEFIMKKIFQIYFSK